MYYIGIDLGTSAVKLLLTDENGKIHNIVNREYPLIFPKEGWSEQNPEDWWNAVSDGIKELVSDINKEKIAGIGTAGQMHGLVILDECDKVIRPAILWNDGRTEEQTEYLNNVIGKDKLSRFTANIAFAGFTAPKILWVKENEPENFLKISKIMLPKDHINYMLTGVHACDYSDASGMLLLDVEHKCWSEEMLRICSVEKRQMPKLFESYEVLGTVKPEIAKLLGINENVKVVAGAGDNAAAAVGTATIGDGNCNISLGTSGTVFISTKGFKKDSFNALHAFAAADGGYHLMGCMLSAASCNKWFCGDILGTDDYKTEESVIVDSMLGNNSVYFLPYLMGERSPINDTNARGTFMGITLNTKREEMLQAVLEGVAFAIKDSVEIAKSLGIPILRSNICGGGAKSPLWKKIMANVLNIPLDTVETEQGPGLGGAILAMVGCGEYETVSDCTNKLVHICDTVYPDSEIAARYEERYKKWSKIYPACRKLFSELKN